MRRVFGIFSVSTSIVVVLSVFAAAGTAGVAVLLGQATDVLLGGGTPDFGWYLGVTTELLIVVLCTALVPWVIAGAGVRMSAHHRDRLLRHYLSIGPLAVRRVGEGELLQIAMDSVDRSVKYRTAFIGPALSAVATPLLVLIYVALFVDPLAAGLMLIPTALVPVIVLGFHKLFGKATGEYRRAQGILSATFLDALRGLGMLKLNGGGTWMGRRIAAASETVRQQVMKLLARNQLILLVIDASFAVLLLATAAGLAWWRSASGTISTGSALSLIVLSFLMLAPVNYVGSFFYLGMTGKAAELKLAQISKLPMHGSVANPLDVDLRARGLQLAEVTAGYDQETTVLHQITAFFPAGSRTAIIGPSGSGKTTLLRVLQGQLDISGGLIHDGVIGMGPATLKANTAVVEQHATLFSLSLRENLQLVAPNVSDEQLLHALRRAGLGQWVHEHPGSVLDEPLGESGARLSGGQAQRLALARALLAERPLLLLDEPTSSLDVATEAEVLATLRALNRESTIITVTHRLGLLEDYDRVIVMGNGRIIESGAYEELLARDSYVSRALHEYQHRAAAVTGLGREEH